jgi:hypothetical protein
MKSALPWRLPLLTAAIIALASFTLGMLTPATASAADTRNAGPSFSQIALKIPNPTASRTASPSVSGPKQIIVITCELSIDNPHNSTHVPGVINVEAHVSCTAPVTSIDLEVLLVGSDGTADLKPFGGVATASLEGNAVVPCNPDGATYEGVAQATVTWPPGFEPSSDTWPVDSPEVSLAC